MAGAKNVEFAADQHYLIAKWGDVDRSLEELTIMAKNRYVTEQEAQLRRTIVDAQSKLASLNDLATLRFGV